MSYVLDETEDDMSIPPPPVGPSVRPFAAPSQAAAALHGATDPDDLDLPLYGATFAQATRRYLRKWNTFSGRASRSEYWWAVLFSSLLGIIPSLFIGLGVGIGFSSASQDEPAAFFDVPAAAVLLIIGMILMAILGVGTIVPDLAITWRRLHDANFPGPYYFFAFIPSFGFIIALVFACLPSKPEGQRFDVVR